MIKNTCYLRWECKKLFEYIADGNTVLHFLEGYLAMSLKIESKHVLCPSNSISENLSLRNKNTGSTRMFISALFIISKITNEIIPINSERSK